MNDDTTRAREVKVTASYIDDTAGAPGPHLSEVRRRKTKEKNATARKVVSEVKAIVGSSQKTMF